MSHGECAPLHTAAGIFYPRNAAIFDYNVPSAIFVRLREKYVDSCHNPINKDIRALHVVEDEIDKMSVH